MISPEDLDHFCRAQQDYLTLDGARTALEKKSQLLSHEDMDNLGMAADLMNALMVSEPTSEGDAEFNVRITSSQAALRRFRKKISTKEDQPLLDECGLLFKRLQGVNLLMQSELLSSPRHSYALAGIG